MKKSILIGMVFLINSMIAMNQEFNENKSKEKDISLFEEEKIDWASKLKTAIEKNNYKEVKNILFKKKINKKLLWKTVSDGFTNAGVFGYTKVVALLLDYIEKEFPEESLTEVVVDFSLGTAVEYGHLHLVNYLLKRLKENSLKGKIINGGILNATTLSNAWLGLSVNEAKYDVDTFKDISDIVKILITQLQSIALLEKNFMLPPNTKSLQDILISFSEGLKQRSDLPDDLREYLNIYSQVYPVLTGKKTIEEYEKVTNPDYLGLLLWVTITDSSKLLKKLLSKKELNIFEPMWLYLTLKTALKFDAEKSLKMLLSQALKNWIGEAQKKIDNQEDIGKYVYNKFSEVITIAQEQGNKKLVKILLQRQRNYRTLIAPFKDNTELGGVSSLPGDIGKKIFSYIGKDYVVKDVKKKGN